MPNPILFLPLLETPISYTYVNSAFFIKPYHHDLHRTLNLHGWGEKEDAKTYVVLNICYSVGEAYTAPIGQERGHHGRGCGDVPQEVVALGIFHKSATDCIGILASICRRYGAMQGLWPMPIWSTNRQSDKWVKSNLKTNCQDVINRTITQKHTWSNPGSGNHVVVVFRGVVVKSAFW